MAKEVFLTALLSCKVYCKMNPNASNASQVWIHRFLDHQPRHMVRPCSCAQSSYVSFADSGTKFSPEILLPRFWSAESLRTLLGAMFESIYFAEHGGELMIFESKVRIVYWITSVYSDAVLLRSLLDAVIRELSSSAPLLRNHGMNRAQTNLNGITIIFSKQRK